MKKIIGLVGTIGVLAFLGSAAHAAGHDQITAKPWGKTPDGKAVTLYTLTNAHGVQAKITNYGGIVTSLIVPDRKGRMGDIVLGYDTLSGYIKNVNNPYFGALIGRYGNRIANGKFTLDGTDYKLAINNTPNSLHGGTKGFDKVVWTAATMKSASGPSVALTYLSKDSEENFPGNLKVKVVYTLTDDNGLKIDYSATTDKDTVVNLTHHSYFNLNGAGNGTILSQVMQINADKFTPVNKNLIPTGIKSVAGTPLDFRTPHVIGARIGKKDPQLLFANGYDHNWVLNKTGMGQSFAARAFSPTTGRVVSVFTTEPGIQLYTGNFLDGKNIGKGGKSYPFRGAFCLETQHYPDSPNHPAFPTTTLKAGETYTQHTVYKFSVR